MKLQAWVLHTSYVHAHFWAQWEKEGQWRNDGKKKQSSYLGRPSSGVPDLKGKQEHSQQRTRDHGKPCDTGHADIYFRSRCLFYLRSVGIGKSGTEKKRRMHRQGQHDEHLVNQSRLQCIISHLLVIIQKSKFRLTFFFNTQTIIPPTNETAIPMHKYSRRLFYLDFNNCQHWVILMSCREKGRWLNMVWAILDSNDYTFVLH